MPRSYSIPNQGFNTELNEYQYEITRDFRAEIQNFLVQKKKKEKKESKNQK